MIWGENTLFSEHPYFTNLDFPGHEATNLAVGAGARGRHFFCGGSTFLLILPPGIPGIIKLPTFFLVGSSPMLNVGSCISGFPLKTVHCLVEGAMFHDPCI